MKRIIWTVVALVLFGAGLVTFGRQYVPGLWVNVQQMLDERFGWTEEARQRDPAGYVDHVIGRLEKDLAELTGIRRELLAQIAELSNKIREQEALADHAERLAEEFRTRYREARAQQAFPVMIRGAAYTDDQVHSQVGLLLAQAKGCRESLERLKKVRDQAETQLEVITVRMNRTEAELVALAAERKLLQARHIISQQARLLAEVESLFTENKRVLATNPVRTVQELLAAVETPSPQEARREEVEAFMNVATPEPPSQPSNGGESTSAPAPDATTSTPAEPGEDSPRPQPSATESSGSETAGGSDLTVSTSSTHSAENPEGRPSAEEAGFSLETTSTGESSQPEQDPAMAAPVNTERENVPPEEGRLGVEEDDRPAAGANSVSNAEIRLTATEQRLTRSPAERQKKPRPISTRRGLPQAQF
ncbi:MAG: hypothetical protein NZ899_02515 [Thermoguttaceae bacterium]|nr:hypothetical protein [Thermoguttaceae bacterium]MDW8079802.1 hypothetical protein [Thermoguttaceae bacterium]